MEVEEEEEEEIVKKKERKKYGSRKTKGETRSREVKAKLALGVFHTVVCSLD